MTTTQRCQTVLAVGLFARSRGSWADGGKAWIVLVGKPEQGASCLGHDAEESQGEAMAKPAIPRLVITPTPSLLTAGRDGAPARPGNTAPSGHVSWRARVREERHERERKKRERRHAEIPTETQRKHNAGWIGERTQFRDITDTGQDSSLGGGGGGGDDGRWTSPVMSGSQGRNCTQEYDYRGDGAMRFDHGHKWYETSDNAPNDTRHNPKEKHSASESHAATEARPRWAARGSAAVPPRATSHARRREGRLMGRRVLELLR
ncbi:unnamed protein product [Lampetra planeri]